MKFRGILDEHDFNKIQQPRVHLKLYCIFACPPHPAKMTNSIWRWDITTLNVKRPLCTLQTNTQIQRPNSRSYITEPIIQISAIHNWSSSAGILVIWWFQLPQSVRNTNRMALSHLNTTNQPSSLRWTTLQSNRWPCRILEQGQNANYRPRDELPKLCLDSADQRPASRPLLHARWPGASEMGGRKSTLTK